MATVMHVNNRLVTSNIYALLTYRDNTHFIVKKSLKISKCNLSRNRRLL